MAKIYHFSGAGNDFVVLDGRREDLSSFREVATIGRLCKEYGTDGLMILSLGDNDSEHKLPGSEHVDFTMECYNPDGSSGMMCGNGGRCIAAFADYLGIDAVLAPKAGAGSGVAPSKRYLFRAADGLHTGEILSRSGSRWQVRLGMIDVEGVKPVLDGYFLNTGTRHFVKFVPDVEAVDIESEGPAMRHNPLFAPEGTNVNFVQVVPGGIKVRTFEKGVEGETLACGTGITASAIATVFSGKASAHKIAVQARRDALEVDFSTDGSRFTDVHLTGPAELL